MNLEQLKEKYKTGDYIVANVSSIDGTWSINSNPSFHLPEIFKYTLVYKKHAEIATKVIENPDLKIEYRWHGEDWMDWEDNFFKFYDENIKYRIKHKQDTGEDMDKFERIVTNNIREAQKETISITAEDGTVYEFTKPDFDCELLKVIIAADGIHILGAYKDLADFDAVTMWCIDNYDDDDCGVGVCYENEAYNLTPINKPWFETCKYPCLARVHNGELFVASGQIKGQIYDSFDDSVGRVEDCTPATKEECMALVVEDD